MIRETIYKRTSSGKVQIWYGELDGLGSYRTVSGQQDGKKTVSAWTACEPKNSGKVNATSAAEQATAELESMYSKKLAREYRKDIGNIDVKTYIKPMLADKWKDRKDKLSEQLIFFQPKFDGMRAIASASTVTASGVQLTSRDGKLIPGAKHIEAQLAPLFKRQPELVLDGELYNHDYKDKFEKLISALKREPANDEDRQRARDVVQYHVYDIPSEGSSNYAVRFAQLDEMFANEPELNSSDMIYLAETHSLIYNAAGKEELDTLLGNALQDGYEGGMVRLNLPYEHKRSKSLMKMKDFMDEEFEIERIEEGKGNWAGYAKVVFIKLKDGRTSKATVKGNREYCKKLLEERADAIGKLGTVTFFRYTNDSVPYLPVFKGVRWDV